MASERLPYPGLRPFQREESDLFFGRDGCVDAMVDRLGGTRFLAVLGASGSGKSSLVYTGLLDGLELGLLAKAGTDWIVAAMRPGNQPMANLACALLAAASESGEPSAPEESELLASFLRRGPLSLVQWWRERNLPARTNLLVLVDQFEELFRYRDYAGREAAERFVALLLASAHAAGVRIYVTITMRSEYLGACALIPGLAEQINAGLYLTPRMSREDIREAITGPASVCGFQLEPLLVNQLLNDLSGLAPWEDDRDRDQLQRLSRRADQLPLMQHVLNRMWVRASARGGPVTLTAQDYAEAGGLVGALDAHAREVLDSLPAEYRPFVQPVFRALVAGTSIADAVRRPCRFDELVALASGREDAVRAIVDAFRDPTCNFLQPPRPVPLEHATVVDISHESLIREWPLLSEWMTAEAHATGTWRRLVSASTAEARKEGDLLHGLDLANFAAWWDREQPTPAWAARYGGGWAEAERFLNASKAAARAQGERERSRQRAFNGVLFGAVALLLAVVAVGAVSYTKLGDAKDAQAKVNQQLAGANLQLVQMNQRLEDTSSESEKQRQIAEHNRLMALELVRATVEAVGADRNLFRAGAEDFERDLLAAMMSRLNEFGNANTGDHATARIQLRARFYSARLAVRRDASDPGKTLDSLFPDLLQEYNQGSPDGDQLYVIAKTAALLSQARRLRHDPAGAAEVFGQLSSVLPDVSSGFETMPAEVLEAHFLAAQERRHLTSNAEEERALAEREVSATKALVDLEPSNARALLLRSGALCDWAEELEGSAAHRAIAQAKQAVLDAHDLDVSNIEYLAALTRPFRMEAARAGDSVGRQRAWESAYSYLKPALALAPGDVYLARAGSSVMTELLKALRERRATAQAASELVDDLIALAFKQVSLNPLDPALAENAKDALRESILAVEPPKESRVETCLSAAKQELTLAKQYRTTPVHVHLLAGAVTCALESGHDLAARATGGDNKPDKPVDAFIQANADEMVALFSGPVLPPERDPLFRSRTVEILQQASTLAAQRHEWERADHYQQVLIDALRGLRPGYDYDFYAMSGLSDAFRALADRSESQGNPAAAAGFYRTCSDPEQVPYPDPACMQSLLKLIESGALGAGHEPEAATLRARMSVYVRRRFSLSSIAPTVRNAAKILVTYPPAGYAGIDNWILWLKRNYDIEVPPDTAARFRELDLEARTKNEPLSLLAVRVLGKAGSQEDRDELDEISEQFKDGQAEKGFQRAEAFYGEARPGDSNGKRRAEIIARLANIIADRPSATGPDGRMALLGRLRTLVAADAKDGPAAVRVAWAEAEEQVAGDLLSYADGDASILPSMQALLADAVALRREPDGLFKTTNSKSKEVLAKDLSLLAQAERSSKAFGEAAQTSAASVALYRELDSQDPTGASARRGALAEALAVQSRSLAELGTPDSSLASEAVALQRRRAEQEGCKLPPSDDYRQALASFFHDADVVQDWNAAFTASRNLVAADRLVATCKPERQAALVTALGNLSYTALLTRNWPSARAAAEEALAIDPSQLWIETNAAHARMLGGDVDGARQIYLANAGKPIPGLGTWNGNILADFRAMRAVGIALPLMDEIEAAFKNAE